MKYATILFLLLSLNVSAQKDFVWSEVVKVDSTLSPKDLYSNAKLWIAKVYGSSKAAIDMMDDNTFTIVVKGMHTVEPQLKGVGAGFSSIDVGWVSYTLTIQCKEGRYKYTIDNCHHVGQGYISGTSNRVDCGPLSSSEPAHDLMGYGLTVKFWNEKLKPDFIANTDLLISRMKIAMAKKSDKTDW